MFRSLHRWFGLIASALFVVLAVSGAALSIFPASEAITSPSSRDISVAQLAARVEAAHPSVDEIRRSPAGRITAFYAQGDQQVAAVIDPATGASLGPAQESPVLRWLTNLHRSLFLGDSGRIVTALGAAAMLLLSGFGLMVMVRRAGGWRFILKPVRGTGDGRLHTVVSRVALPGLLLSSLTALWMTASTFGLVPQGAGAPAFPAEVSGRTGVALGTVEILKQTSVSALRSLTFPASGDPTDAFTLKTVDGQGYIDQGSGKLLAFQAANWVDKVNQTVKMLHTGRGFAALGLLLGLTALSVPLLSWTGLTVWLKSRNKQKTRSKPARDAETIVLVASEGGTTWGFADTLYGAMSEAGLSVHVGQIAHFDPARWPKAKRVILLAATYGDGAAPASAEGFLERFATLPAKPGLSLTVLGFGDRSFPAFCGFARKMDEIARANGWRSLVAFDTIDRQSPQDFARWGQALGHALGKELVLHHQPEVPQGFALQLVSRRDFGANVQAATSILRFALPKVSLWQRLTGRGTPRFEAGDLLGVVPQGSKVPRFYSLASGAADGFVEICVRRQAGGLCSSQLTRLEPGERIDAFVRANPGFRPKRGRKPVILIGAGAGIAPLAGFARANHRHQPMHLYFGTRHPEADALYAEELTGWHDDGRLGTFSVAFSRTPSPAYVQDLLRKDAPRLGKLLAAGGQILVCGGRDMAAGVAKAIAEILEPQGLTLTALKAEGRYAEDVF